MKRRSIWLKKALAVSICAVMAAQPAVTFAEDFADAAEESTQETAGTAEGEGEIGDTAVKEPEAADDAEQPKAPGEEIDPSVFPEESEDITEVPSEDEEETAETLEPEEDSTEDSEDSAEELFSDGEAFSAGSSEEKSGTCGKNVTWTLKDGIMTISGNGDMDDFYTIRDWWTGELVDQNEPEWDDFRDEILEVYIQDGVTSIGTTAFSNCSNLTKIVIGNSVKTIGHDAFANDMEVTDLTVGNSVQNIYVDAFYGLKIKKLVLPASLTNIADGALLGLWSLEEIQIPDNGVYKSIDGALYKDGGKTLYMYPPKRTGEYTVPSSVEKIYEDAFTYTSLTKITIPDNVTEISQDAISFADNLETLIFGKGCKTIPDRCCWYDKVLSNVVIPEGVTTIGDDAFRGCESLKEITIPSTVINLGTGFPSTTKLIFAGKGFQEIEDGSYVNGVNVNVQAKEMYSKAFEVLNLVNKERAKKGLDALVMDQSLLETAMMRGFENVLYWDHTRPNGKDCFTANSGMFGENIAWGSTTASGVMNQWMNSDGHRANILGSGYKSIGIGCVYYKGTYYWVQCFGSDSKNAVSASSYKDQTRSRKIVVSKDKTYYKASLKLSATSLKKGQTAEASVLWNGTALDNSGAKFESSDPSVCTVDNNGRITAVSAGSAVISMYFEGYENGASTQKVTVTNPAPSTAKLTFNANGGTVTTKSKTVKLKAKAGTLPSPVRKGYTFTGWYTAKSGGAKVTSATVISKSQTLYARWTKTTVSKASIKKLTNTAGRNLNVYINTVKGVKGYQIVYAEKSNFSGYKRLNTAKTTAVLKNLKKNKTYYVKVRAYKTDSAGKTVYGSYSAVKKITIRK